MAPHRVGRDDQGLNPLGKLPGSVWTVATEPLRVPDHLGIDHFAAFPTEWPKRIIQGWSPAGVCVECGEGRRPVAGHAEWRADWKRENAARRRPRRNGGSIAATSRPTRATKHSTLHQAGRRRRSPATPAPAPSPPPPPRPAVVLDPFGGTGTTAMVAKALGRHGISVDMSADYCRLAEWRVNDRDQLAKVLGVAKAEQQDADQLSMFDLDGGAA